MKDQYSRWLLKQKWFYHDSEYGGSFEAGAGTLRLYVHAVALARAAADAAQQAMEKEFQAIDALKERLQVGCCSEHREFSSSINKNFCTFLSAKHYFCVCWKLLRVLIIPPI